MVWGNNSGNNKGEYGAKKSPLMMKSPQANGP